MVVIEERGEREPEIKRKFRLTALFSTYIRLIVHWYRHAHILVAPRRFACGFHAMCVLHGLQVNSGLNFVVRSCSDEMLARLVVVDVFFIETIDRYYGRRGRTHNTL